MNAPLAAELLFRADEPYYLPSGSEVAVFEHCHALQLAVMLKGPTGCGKTTSLYAMLAQVKDVGVKAVTVEDPVEYELGGIGQLLLGDSGCRAEV